ncbi:hypothetical protein [Alistipes sp.]|uniref:hypothetical protein n=1 Tax=Alistipes sp. TaxID=1872444 RepID=UPI00352710E7
MTVKERIKTFIQSLGLTNQRFEAECGLSNGYISNMRKGVGEEALERISNRFPDLSRAWLLTGEGEMLKSAAQAAPLATTDTITMPREAWEVIRDQAASLKAKDVSLERKDKQIDEMLSMLRKQIEKGEDAGYHGHAATRAAAE